MEDQYPNANSAFPEPEIPATPPPTEPAGYTVTPEGGFYNDYATPPQAVPVPPMVPPPAMPRNEEVQPPLYGWGKPPKPPKKSRGIGTVIAAIVLSAIIGFGGALGGIALYENGKLPFLKGERKTAGNGAGGNTENVVIDVNESADSIAAAVAQKASESVVGIRTTAYVQSFFYGETEQTGEGSGVIYSKDGYIITNYHVIQSVAETGGKAKVEVYVKNAETTPYEAQIIGYNISSDLAVIQIKAKNLKPIELGSADELTVGQYVVTIGSPGGLDFMGSVTYGIISGLGRRVSSDSDVPLIQTDAAINPGNSGGALLNAEGKLIGINSSKIAATEYEGMGFAIPINIVLERCKKIIQRQGEDDPYIGITISMKYTAEALEYYGYPVGAVVSAVADGSPAQKSGIERGDIITEFDGKEIGDPQKLIDLIADSSPGDTVTIKFYRSGRYYSTDIKIGSNG